VTPEATNSNNTDAGFTPRKRRVSSLNQSVVPTQISNVSGQSTSRSRTSVSEAYRPSARPPKPLTALDKARQAKVAEWEGKLHGVIDHHDSLARELYHLETYATTLSYDPVKLKADHSERMLRVSNNGLSKRPYS
jgi:hypothetical protein